MTPDQILAFVAALVAVEPDTSTFPLLRSGGADSRYEVALAPCAKPVSPLEIEGKTLICGTVNVPEDHAAPEGRRMDLKFAVYKSRSLVPAPDAAVHLHGGPGCGIVDAMALTSTYFERLRARRDIVAFDQRGVDASGGDTRCVATVAENVGEMAAAMSGTALAPGAYDALAASCLAELAANGTDITKINTCQNARDVQAVMRALGYPTYNVYGLSYGTKLGLEVMRSAPEGVRALAQVALHFDGTQEERLAALIRLMSPADLALTIARVATDNCKVEQVLMENFEALMFFCQEDMDINSIDGARRANAESGFPPFLTEMFEKALSDLFPVCARFPASPRPGFHDPVVSPIPALVFSGLMDTQRAASWGPDTARHLGNARSVVFPETGHGALAFSDCAQDLGVAFLEKPEAELDFSCAEVLKPVFVLPPAAE